MVSNYVMLLVTGMALLLSVPLQAAWTSAVDGTMLGKRMPTLLALQASAGRSVDGTGVTGVTGGIDAGAGAGAGVVLVDFGIPWCVPCRDDVPLLNRLQHDYGARGLTVLGMARAPPVDVIGAARPERRDDAQGSDANNALLAQLALELAPGLRRGDMPLAVLVDRNGIIVWQGDPAGLSRGTIERTLAAPALGKLLRF